MSVKIIGSPPGELYFENADLLAYTEIHETIGSTNARMRELFEQQSLFDFAGHESYVLVASDAQTAGRGRTQRAWQSPPEKNIYFTLGTSLGAGREIATIKGLSLAIGMLLRQVFLDLGIDSVQVKWPNDLVSKRGKIAGILIETQNLSFQHWGVLIGVGINVNIESQDFQVEQPWSSLCIETGHQFVRSSVLTRIIEALVKGIEQFKQKGWHSFYPQWAGADLLYGKFILVLDHQGNQIHAGQCQGVNKEGQLVLCDEQRQIHLITSGDIKVRLSQN